MRRNLHPRQEHPHDRRGHEPVAPAHDRRHDDPQVSAEDAGRLYPHDQALCCVSRPLTRHGEPGGGAALSAASCRERCASAYSQSHCVGASVLFRVTLRRPDIIEYTTFIRAPLKLPVVLSPEEVARLLNAAPGLKYKAALSVAYGAGLRACEVVSLKVKRMLIRVEQGKGHKDRNVMLSPHLLELLRAWWKAARPRGWLFPGQNRVNHLTMRQLNRACHAAAQMA